MGNCYVVQSQKTYKGKTAGGWLKTANIAESKAGIAHVWLDIPGVGNCQIQLADDGDMVISSYDGIVAALETSAKAYRTLKALAEAQEEANLKIARTNGYI